MAHVRRAGAGAVAGAAAAAERIHGFVVDRLIVDFEKIDFLIVDGLYAIKAPDIDMRIAAYVVAVARVAEAMKLLSAANVETPIATTCPTVEHVTFITSCGRSRTAHPGAPSRC